MSESKVKVWATIDDNGEHWGRTDFVPVKRDNHPSQMAVHRNDGVFYFSRRVRGSRTFHDFLDAELEGLRAIRRLLSTGGGTDWITDAEGEYGLAVEVQVDGTAALDRGESRSPVELEQAEVAALVALIDWVESTFLPPV